MEILRPEVAEYLKDHQYRLSGTTAQEMQLTLPTCTPGRGRRCACRAAIATMAIGQTLTRFEQLVVATERLFSFLKSFLLAVTRCLAAVAIRRPHSFDGAGLGVEGGTCNLGLEPLHLFTKM